MPRRSRTLTGLLLFTSLGLTTAGIAGITATANAAPETATTAHAEHAAYSMPGMPGMEASTKASGDDPDGDGYIMADPPVTGVTPSTDVPPTAYFHEFQAKCAPTHTAPDDPIVYPGQPGKSHDHTFMGNTTTDAYTTAGSLESGDTTCLAPGDKSGYWMPSLFKGTPRSSRTASRPSTTSPVSPTTAACARSPRACGTWSAARCRARRSSRT